MTRHSAIALALASRSPAATAHAAKRFTIRGAGFGHGVGMSQYGAMGYARARLGLQGDPRATTTPAPALGVLDAPREVRVLLQSTGSAAFSGASRAGGAARSSPERTYSARGRAGGQVELLAPRGRVARARSPRRCA